MHNEIATAEVHASLLALLQWLRSLKDTLSGYCHCIARCPDTMFGDRRQHVFTSTEEMQMQLEEMLQSASYLEQVLFDLETSGPVYGSQDQSAFYVTTDHVLTTARRIDTIGEEICSQFDTLCQISAADPPVNNELAAELAAGGRHCRKLYRDIESYGQTLQHMADIYAEADNAAADIFSGGRDSGWQTVDEAGLAPKSATGQQHAEATLDLPDDVQFRLAAPAALNRDEYTLVKFMMYEGDDYARADREAQQLADRVKQNSSSLYPVARGERLRVCLQSEDVEIEEPSQELVWNGKYASCDFEIMVPAMLARKQARIKARVYQGFAVLTDLRLILNVTGEQPVSAPAEMCRYRSAFLSYASQDRPKVIGCLRGMRLMRDDLDVFMDVISLRRGEYYEQRIMEEIDRRDLFYLFWSRNAAQSAWVRKELAYALEKKSVDRIEPVPLETPELCPPPKALNDRHFNDWLLRYEQQQQVEE